MLLSIRNVEICYHTVPAVSDVSLDVEEGQIVTIIGGNGAGKSTLFWGISGLRPLSKGEIWFKESRIDGASPKSIVQKGIVQIPEGRHVFPFMSVLENLNVGALLRRDKDQIKRDLKDVFHRFPRLEERKSQAAGTLSGGEQQQLAVGRALMSRPTLLLMDEPTLGLSPIMSMEIAKVIADINKMGVTILLSEQNSRMALKLAHKGCVQERGKMIMQDDACNLLNNEDVKKAYLGG